MARRKGFRGEKLSEERVLRGLRDQELVESYYEKPKEKREDVLSRGGEQGSGRRGGRGVLLVERGRRLRRREQKVKGISKGTRKE